MTIELPVLAVTPGEPAGVGPEILVRLCHDHPEHRLLAVADPRLLRQAADRMNIELRIREWHPGEAAQAGELACFPVSLARPSLPGRPDSANAAYVLETLRRAFWLIEQGFAAAMVTGPVQKSVINDGGFAFSGHTEFLADLSNSGSVVMMLTAPGLRVALATTHLPLREVADALTAGRLERVIRITEKALRKRFNIAQPRLQVLGLNPHAGEAGHLGVEDDTVIRPVIEKCCADGLRLEGPVPADTAFTPPRIAGCDAIVAMYHDQGLPVLKHVGFGQAVNITLGLRFIRTSVDHGTALDIAGTGDADTGSLHQAVLMAQRMCKTRHSPLT